MYVCEYCHDSTHEFKNIIHHLTEHHEKNEIKFSTIKGNKTKTINYKISPEICREQGRTITVDSDNMKIHVSKRNTLPKDSPMKKILKTDINMTDCENVEDFHVVEEIEDDNEVLKELTILLPTVLKSLKECDKIDEYIAFNKLVCEGKFPLNNIAFLLFLDVVRWFSTDSSSNMRYSEECKLFWSTGLKLFRGRFLKFMSGPKNAGQLSESEGQTGTFSPSNSNINFAVPNRNMLKDEIKMVPADKPGIIHTMIEAVSKNDPDQLLTYKICVDGKKINPTSAGEVNLWGYEDKPTFEMKKNRLLQESSLFTTEIKRVERQIILGKSNIIDVIECERNTIVDGCRKVITALSNRIKDLRKLKVGKELALKKLQDQIEGDWRNSNYAMVISCLRTNVYQIDNCIEDILNTNESICEYAAGANGISISSTIKTHNVDMEQQDNYVCLGTSLECDTKLIKQRSDLWHEIRKKCLVTGSTINKAIGLDGLKQQINHIETKAGRKEPEEVSAELQSKFDYGSENELNAVATLISTFIPAFNPDALVYEEGCYVMEENGKPYLVVSPDGSVRKKGDETQVLAALEIKCPMPGKIYTTQVQYALPHYYVPQVLSEMKCLKVNILYFVSYGTESTVVHTVEFDENLWQDICDEMKKLDPQKSPKKLSVMIPELKLKVTEFKNSRVCLVAELKSKIAKPCKHSPEIVGRIFHRTGNTTKSNKCVLLQDLQKAFIRGSDAIQTSHKLCSQKANEVLVFLLADLDRIHKPEVPHAFPIAYALKGYSMKANAMRQMLEAVYHELFLKGLYTPVVSYDGQWAALTYRDNTGNPLTLLELQKQVYNEVKSRKKTELTKVIFETGVVKADDLSSVVRQAEYTYNIQSKAVDLASKTGTKLFQPSCHIKYLIQTYSKNGKKGKSKLDEERESGIDQILSTVSTDLLLKLNEEEIQCITDINNNVSLDDIEGNTQSDTIEDISDSLFAKATMHELENEHIKGITDNTVGFEVDTNDTMEIEVEMSNIELLEENRSKEVPTTILSTIDMQNMLLSLQSDDKTKIKWANKPFSTFIVLLGDTDKLMSEMSKYELNLCLNSVSDILKRVNVRYSKNWNKFNLADLIKNSCFQHSADIPSPSVTKCRRRRRRTPDKLVTMCKKSINRIPKPVLNAVMSEHIMLDRIDEWRNSGPFTPVTKVDNENVSWFSKPELNTGTLSYIFSFLDVHHLITNCRVKVCKDGFPSRGIDKIAWRDVAKENNTNLKISHVEDLVDKQSDAIARETFSKDVEREMSNKYPCEANFCKIIREFYEAEDDPGISATVRYRRRMSLRKWLLHGVNVCRFPPYGSHIRDIPNTMFQGFITNIERRMQLFPYVKSGAYNVRSLGSLEAENLFGQFQDLDPKGTGVIKAEEVPAALETACQLMKVRLQPDRPFHMSLSRAKVYPMHELLTETGTPNVGPFVYPSIVSQIYVRDHMFDAKSRGKRKARRRLVDIKGPHEAARGVTGVRQFHKCDESKILLHKRLGIDI